MPAAMPSSDTLGKYTVLEPLGGGSMGFVYKGLDPATGRAVALKTIPRTLLDRYGTAMSARLQNEARAATRLRHPGIVEVYGFGERPELAFIAMEFVDGCGLPSQLRLPVADAVSIILQVLDALDYAHEQGVVHHDIKPSNLLLTSDGRIKLSDFGVVRLDDTVRAQEAVRTGEASYMSPEQFMGLPVDRRSDLFSAGVLLYELLTGTNPFAGPPEQLIDRVCNENPRALSEVNSEVSIEFNEVCGHALAKAVYDRYPTAGAFRDAVLEAYGRTTHVAPKRTVSPASLALIASRGKLRGGRMEAAQQSPTPVVPRVWDQEILHTVEQQLARYVGPLARIIVKEAASRTNDLDRLYSLAAESIDREDERKAFLARGAQRGRNGESNQSVTPAPAPLKEQPAIGQSVPVAVKSRGAAPQPKLASPNSPARVARAQSPPQILESGQADTLAGYLGPKPPKLDHVINAFIAAAQAVGEAYASNPKLEPLIPESISFDSSGKATVRTAQTGTASSAGVGNPHYAAPESFSETAGEASSGVRAHIYSLGFMFYEILLGRQLFEKTFSEQRTDLDWLRWHADMERTATSLRSLVPGYPAACSELLDSMVEKHADKRPQDFETVLARLRTLARQAETTMVLCKGKRQPAASKPAKKRRKWLILIVLLLLLLAGGVYCWQDPVLYQKALSYFSQLKQGVGLPASNPQ